MGTQILIDDSKGIFLFSWQRDFAVDQTAIKQNRKSPQSSLYKHVAIGTSRQEQRAKCKFQTQISNLPHAPRIWMLFWRPIPLTTPLFVPFLLGFQTDSFSPPKKILYVSYISGGKKDKSLPTPDSPRVSPPTALFSSQVSCTACLRAFLCPRFSTASSTADPPYLCVITHRVPLAQLCGSERQRNVDESRTTESFWLKPIPRLVLCSRLCARSHWDPIQLSRWDRGASLAPSDGHDANRKPASHFVIPASHLDVRMWNIKIYKCRVIKASRIWDCCWKNRSQMAVSK